MTKTTSKLDEARLFTSWEAYDVMSDNVGFEARWLRSERKGFEIVNYFVVTVDRGEHFIAE